ncbi:DUF4159 domain-containing protein [Pirellulaceae bacterium]|jgi:hypothetical protein|nr:DUF4159 domain-containing protein [Pirellulaceae bacterium]
MTRFVTAIIISLSCGIFLFANRFQKVESPKPAFPRLQKVVETAENIEFTATLAPQERWGQLEDDSDGVYRPKQTPWRRRPLPNRSDFPTWKIESKFERDVFTFVRIQYDAYGPFGWWDRWDNDYPDGDWNFSFRLKQLTSMEVAPNGKVLRLSDPELLNHPFAYMAGVQYMRLDSREQAAFRRYLLNGGFVMMDDFWTDDAIDNVFQEMQRVLPNSKPVELSLDHPIFHLVYDLKELPQVTDLKTWQEGYKFEHWHRGYTSDQAPHFWAYFDDNDRMVALLCHNNDVGDGWEREGENREYFLEFSEKKSYPLGINIITYAMTH